jgi:hypothetical protein
MGTNSGGGIGTLLAETVSSSTTRTIPLP